MRAQYFFGFVGGLQGQPETGVRAKGVGQAQRRVGGNVCCWRGSRPPYPEPRYPSSWRTWTRRYWRWRAPRARVPLGIYNTYCGLAPAVRHNCLQAIQASPGFAAAPGRRGLALFPHPSHAAGRSGHPFPSAPWRTPGGRLWCASALTAWGPRGPAPGTPAMTPCQYQPPAGAYRISELTRQVGPGTGRPALATLRRHLCRPGAHRGQRPLVGAEPLGTVPEHAEQPA